jgi:hypothetical protein
LIGEHGDPLDLFGYHVSTLPNTTVSNPVWSVWKVEGVGDGGQSDEETLCADAKATLEEYTEPGKA